jgi:hypothetical protein
MRTSKGGLSYCDTTVKINRFGIRDNHNRIERGLISRAEDFYRRLLDEIAALQKLIKN